MRERKFKIWEKKGKGWLDVSYLFLDSDGKVIGYTVKGNTWTIDKVELVDFTGKKDKNGKEIYEFDWLSDGTSHPMLVVWDRYGWYPFTKNTMMAGKMEVMGNKYEGLLTADNPSIDKDK